MNEAFPRSRTHSEGTVNVGARPERGIEAVEPERSAEPFERMVRSIGGGDRVPARALMDQTVRIERDVERIRTSAAERTRDRLSTLFGRRITRLGSSAAILAATYGLPGCTIATHAHEPYAADIAHEFYEPPKEKRKGPWPDMPAMDAMVESLSASIVSDNPSHEEQVRAKRYVQVFVDNAKAFDEARKRDRIAPVPIETTSCSGFSEFFGLPDDGMERIITKTYPLKMVQQRAMASVDVCPPGEFLAKQGSSIHTVSEHSVRFETFDGSFQIPSSMNVYAQPDTPRHFFDSFDQGVAAANNWETSPALYVRDRIAFLYAIKQLVHAPGRIRFSSVESMRDLDPSVDRFRGMTERYWTELLSLAFSARGASPDQWVRDFQLRAAELHEGENSPDVVRDLQLLVWYFRTIDPGYEPWAANEKRDDMTSEFVYESIGKELDALVEERMPPGAVRTMLTNLIQADYSTDERVNFMIREHYRAVQYHADARMRPLIRAYVHLYGVNQEAQIEELKRKAPEAAPIARAFARMYASVEGWKFADGQRFELDDPRTSPYVAGLARAMDEYLELLRLHDAKSVKRFEAILSAFVRVLSGTTGHEPKMLKELRSYLKTSFVEQPERLL